MNEKRFYALLHLGVHLAAWLPLLWWGWSYWQGELGLNPVRELTLRTGKGALIFLLLSLTCTPLRLMFGWQWVMRVRRALGLYAFLYAAIHLLVFVGLDYGFELAFAFEAMLMNQFIWVGLAAFLILIPLALTSNKRSFQWLGVQRWQLLHRLSYLAAVLAILHYGLLARQYYTQPLIYGGILALLLGVRAAAALMKRRPSAGRS
jgi:methionine sulfoxide reductase heme-binding subunit